MIYNILIYTFYNKWTFTIAYTAEKKSNNKENKSKPPI